MSYEGIPVCPFCKSVLIYPSESPFEMVWRCEGCEKYFDPIRDELARALKAIVDDADMHSTFETAAKRTGIYADTSIPEFNEWCERTAKLAEVARAALAKHEKAVTK